MLAAYHGHADLVRFLVQHGADPNRLNDRQQSPLAGAVFKKEDDVIEVSWQQECFPGRLIRSRSSLLGHFCSQSYRLLSKAALTQSTALPLRSSVSPCSSRRTGGGRDSNLRLVGGKPHPKKANDMRLNKPMMRVTRDLTWTMVTACEFKL